LEWVAETKGNSMADYAETISLADTKLGDRWIGISTIVPTINDETPVNDLERVVMVFRLGKSNEAYILDSDDLTNDIIITDPNGWEASIPARDDFLPRAGKWSWELQFYQVGYDAPWTLYRGVLTVHSGLS
jgi:hypothetical protein